MLNSVDTDWSRAKVFLITAVSEVRLSYDDETSASYILNLETDTSCPVVQSVESLFAELASLLSNLGVSI